MFEKKSMHILIQMVLKLKWSVNHNIRLILVLVIIFPLKGQNQQFVLLVPDSPSLYHSTQISCTVSENVQSFF